MKRSTGILLLAKYTFIDNFIYIYKKGERKKNINVDLNNLLEKIAYPE